MTELNLHMTELKYLQRGLRALPTCSCFHQKQVCRTQSSSAMLAKVFVRRKQFPFSALGVKRFCLLHMTTRSLNASFALVLRASHYSCPITLLAFAHALSAFVVVLASPSAGINEEIPLFFITFSHSPHSTTPPLLQS